MTRRTLTLALALALAGGALLLSGCVPNAPATGSTTVQVESSDTACDLDTTSVAAGTVVFTVNNTGERVTEFYLTSEDGASIVAEVEDIAPGSSRDLTVTLEAGDYVTLCKPGMEGEGVGAADFTVTGADRTG